MSLPHLEKLHVEAKGMLKATFKKDISMRKTLIRDFEKLNRTMPTIKRHKFKDSESHPPRLFAP